MKQYEIIRYRKMQYETKQNSRVKLDLNLQAGKHQTGEHHTSVTAVKDKWKVKQQDYDQCDINIT